MCKAMSREIKFRYIWQHKESGQFKVEIQTLEEIEGEDSWQGPRPYNLVSRDQYTGLKDESNSEVFEGDILKWNHGDGYFEVRWYRSGWGMFSKLFSRFGFPEGRACDSVHALGYAETSTIIGNIHQNQELLRDNAP